MRHKETRQYDERFREANVLASRVDVFRDIFGDIHTLPSSEFHKLYVERQAFEFVSSEILSEISRTNISTWKEVLNDADSDRCFEASIGTTRSANALVAQIVSPRATGKTTYCNYLLKEIIPRYLDDSTCYIPITFDVLSINIQSGFIDESLFEHINNTLDESVDFLESSEDARLFRTTTAFELDMLRREANRENIPLEVGTDRATYDSQRKFLTRRFYKNPLGFLQLKINAIVQRGNFKIVLLVDNIDQHYSMNPGPAITTLGQVARFLNIDCIVTLRDTTYRALTTAETSNSFHPPATFVLSSAIVPDIGARRLEVVRKRAVEALGGDDNPIVRFIDHLLEAHKKLQQSDLKERAALLGDDSSYNYQTMWLWIERIYNGDLRSILDSLFNTLKSNHITSDDFSKQRGIPEATMGPQKDINIKRMKTALINGVEANYGGDNTHGNVINLFDHDGSQDSLHLTFRLKLLQYLCGRRPTPLRELLRDLENKIPDRMEDIRATLILFLRFQLLSIEVRIADVGYRSKAGPGISLDAHLDDYCLVTPNGSFHLNTLIYDDVYLDEMKFSTDISVPEYQRIFRHFSLDFALGRKITTGRFIEAIQEEEKLTEHLSRTLGVPLLGTIILDRYNRRKRQEDPNYHAKVDKLGR